MSNRRRDIVNVGSQIATKVVSIPYSLVMTGLAVRSFPEHGDYLLLAAANYLSMLGLLQAGLGTYVARRVAQSHAETGVLGDLPDVRGAFWFMAGAGALAATAVLVSGALPAGVVPAALLLLAALSAGLADNIRLAVGDAAKSNLFVLAAYGLCALMMTAALTAPTPNLGLAIVAATTPQYLANLMSFAFLLRRREFRALVRPDGAMRIWRPLADAAPLFMFSLGTAGLLNAPLAGKLLPAFPALPIESLACLRLFSNGLNVYFFVLLPLMPIILRERQARTPAAFARFMQLMVGGLLGLNLLGGAFFALVAPTFIHVWLGGLHVTPGLAIAWGVIAALWMAIVTAAYFFQVLFMAYRGVACLVVAVLVTLAAPIVGLGASVESALIAGLLAGLAAAFLLALFRPGGVLHQQPTGAH